MRKITHITLNTVHLVEPGDLLHFHATPDHREDWEGPRDFDITVLRTHLRSIHGPRIFSVEKIGEGEDDDWYLYDNWEITVIEPQPQVPVATGDGWTPTVDEARNAFAAGVLALHGARDAGSPTDREAAFERMLDQVILDSKDPAEASAVQHTHLLSILAGIRQAIEAAPAGSDNASGWARTRDEIRTILDLI
ncbi:hypothetical protein ACFVAJ_17280 [Agromyces sp. NPDC057679]|uniref:hypothetical protein n=1 Tax=Agromyces sp. NPDC057679 TaxID=3346207 RepID=UPI003670FB10